MHAVHLLWDVREIALRGNQLWIQQRAVVFVYIHPGCWWPLGKTNREKIRKGTFATAVLFVTHRHQSSLGSSGWEWSWTKTPEPNKRQKLPFSAWWEDTTGSPTQWETHGSSPPPLPSAAPWKQPTVQSSLLLLITVKTTTRQSRFASWSFPAPYLLKLLVTSEEEFCVDPDGQNAEAKSSTARRLADNEPTAMTESSGVNGCC